MTASTSVLTLTVNHIVNLKDYRKIVLSVCLKTSICYNLRRLCEESQKPTTAVIMSKNAVILSLSKNLDEILRHFVPQYDNPNNRLQIADGRWWVVENRRPLQRDPSTPLRVTIGFYVTKKVVIFPDASF